MKNILRWLSWQKIVFLIVLGIVIFQNRITGNQYLSGWDNLQPEINFGLELSRQLSAVWQEFRGLGHLGGMGHAADLPRTLILWLFSWVVPTNFLRWGWHVGMITLGPIGIWYMGRKLWKWSESTVFTASIFYMLNMATVQYFYTPYEAFSAFYGFLPWLISSFAMFLENGKKRDGVRLLFVSLLATTAFYVQTLFVVYTILLFVISLGYLKQWRRVLTAGIIVFVANAFWLLPVIYFVLSNAGVVGISKINSIASPETAYMNEATGGWRDVLSMKGFWLEYLEWRGNDWGRLLQVWQEWSNRNVVQALSLSFVGVSILGIVVGAIKKRIGWWVGAVFILTFIMLASNNPPLGFAYTYLTEKIPFFGEMFRSVFTKWSVVIGMVIALGVGAMVEVVRIRKWIMTILTMFIVGMTGYIVWPVFGGNLIFQSMKVEYPNEYKQLYNFFGEQDKSERIVYLPSAWAWGWQYHNWGYRGSGFLWYGIEQPILDRAFDVWSPYNEGFYSEFSNAVYGCDFAGSLPVSPTAQLNISVDGRDLLSGRDPGGCGEQVAKVLQKYDVRYALLDESVIAPGQDKEILRIEETKKLAEELGWEQKFQEGFLTVWDTGLQSSEHLPTIAQGSELGSGEQGVTAPGNYAWVEGDTSKVREDVVWDQVGTYVESQSSEHSLAQGSELGEQGAVVYPFAGLMREEVKGVEYGEEGMTVSTAVTSDTVTRELVIPGWRVGDIVRVEFEDGEAVPAYRVNGVDGPRFLGKERPEKGKNIMYARISEGNEWEEFLASTQYVVHGTQLNIEVPGEPQIYDFGKAGKEKIENCDVLGRGRASKAVEQFSSNAVYVADERGAACDYVTMSELDTRLPYLMRIQGENVEGRSVKFFLYNTGSKRNDIEWLMKSQSSEHSLSQGSELLGAGKKFDSTFSLLPWSWDGYYTLNIETRSFGQRAENRVEPVEVRYFPIEQIAGARIIMGEQRASHVSPLQITHVKKTGTWLYGVGVQGTGLLRLSQGYDDGWIAIQVPNLAYNFAKFGTLEHVRVDGWANGFIIGAGDQSSDHSLSQGSELRETRMVAIFYWPQMLEYLGFAMLGITGVGLIYGRKG